MARIRNTVSLLLPFSHARKLQVGATVEVRDTSCTVKGIATRIGKDGFVRVTFAKQKAAGKG